MCPLIKEIDFVMTAALSLEVIFRDSLSFPHLAHLRLVGPQEFYVTFKKSEELANRLKNSYPKLTGFSVIDIGLENKVTQDLIGYLKDFQCLTKIEYVEKIEIQTKSINMTINFFFL